MAENLAQTNPAARRVHLDRAFRPLLYWLVISAVLLAFDFHRKNAPLTTITFSVFIDREAVRNLGPNSATMGKQLVGPGSVVPVGWRRLRVSRADAGYAEVPLFVWYGSNNAGQIDLKWDRGTLDLAIAPRAKSVRVDGPHYSFSLANSSGISVSVPVGFYTVSSTFDYAFEQGPIEVLRGVTNRLVVRPAVGTLKLTSEPSGAKFLLSGGIQNNLTKTGDVPALIEGLPVGKYALRVWRDDYLKEEPIQIMKWETNRAFVQFEYGEVKVLSEPDGATIVAIGSNGEKSVGQTPTTLGELRPGRYRFRLEKEGFSPVEVFTEVVGTNSITLSTNLMTVRYAEAMANARRDASSLSPDYRRALSNVELALKERPDDAGTLALKSEIEAAFRGHEERVAQDKKQADLDGRKSSAKEAFERATSGMRQPELFDTHIWEFQSQVSKVRDAVLRAFTKGSTVWIVDKETKISNETVAFHCHPKGLYSLGRQCVVVASQVDTDEVQVYAKFWDYVVSNKATLNLFQGVTPDSLIPVNKTYFPPEQAATIEARRRSLPENFHKTLQNEMR